MRGNSGGVWYKSNAPDLAIFEDKSLAQLNQEPS